jgi:hypothetical protein
MKVGGKVDGCFYSRKLLFAHILAQPMLLIIALLKAR